MLDSDEIARLVPPDPLRLRYRAELGATVRAVVLGGRMITDTEVRACIPKSVRMDDLETFVALALVELRALHGGNAVRFGISASDLQHWIEVIRHP